MNNYHIVQLNKHWSPIKTPITLVNHLNSLQIGICYGSVTTDNKTNDIESYHYLYESI